MEKDLKAAFNAGANSFIHKAHGMSEFEDGIPVVEIARYFGISSPSVSEMLRGGESAAAGIS